MFSLKVIGDRVQVISVILFFLVAPSACSFGPSELKYGHLAYNTALKATTDEELLLNIVRLRYLDTLEFLEATSISAQSSFSASLGAQLGTELGRTKALAIPEVAYSTRPTFTFIPERGHEFARNIMRPLDPDILGYLTASDWDIEVLLRLLVRDMNGLTNRIEGTDPEFIETGRRMGELQRRNELFLAVVEEPEILSDPIDNSQVSGSDLVEAARSGYHFKRVPGEGTLILMGVRTQTVLFIKPGSEGGGAIIRALKLQESAEGYYKLNAGTGMQRQRKRPELKGITMRTASLLDAILYLTRGVEVPAVHLQDGYATRDWPGPGVKPQRLEGFFQVRFSRKKPDASLSVRYRDHWFYLAENDADSRSTFLILAELFRLGLTETKTREIPVLTLPLGGP